MEGLRDLPKRDLEQEFVRDLQSQGYEYVPCLNTPEKLLANVRDQLQTLNNTQFADGEWLRFYGNLAG